MCGTKPGGSREPNIAVRRRRVPVTGTDRRPAASPRRPPSGFLPVARGSEHAVDRSTPPLPDAGLTGLAIQFAEFRRNPVKLASRYAPWLVPAVLLSLLVLP